MALLPALAGLLVLLLVVPVWPHRRRPLAQAFFVFIACTSIWALGYALELSSPDLARGLFWANVEYFGIPCVAASFFAVVLLVAGIQRYRRTAWAGLGLYCGSVWVAAWTDPWHHLLRRNITFDTSRDFLDIRFARGPIYTINVVISYGLLALGVILLVRMAFSSNSLSRKQGQILLLGVSMPVAGNFAHLFSLDAIPGFDQTPVLFALSAITIAYGLFRWSLISVAPIARDKIVDGLSDAVIVFPAMRSRASTSALWPIGFRISRS